MSVVFAENHTGMRICLSGALKATGKGGSYGRSELERHIELMGREYYNGNTAIVDTFLQLYCVAENERKDALAKNNEVEA